MQANLKVDENLLAQAMEISGIDTQTAVLNFVLKEYLRKDNQKKFLNTEAQISRKAILRKCGVHDDRCTC